MRTLESLGVLARLELAVMVRRQWVRLFAIVFAVISSAIAYSTAGLDDSGGPDGFSRTTVALVPLILMLVPLAALLIGISGQSDEPGGEAFLFTQPVSRSEVLLGRWLGEGAALVGAVCLGFGAGAVVVGTSGSLEGIGSFGVFVLVSALLAGVFLSLAALVAVVSGPRTAALGRGCFIWFVLVILHDTIALWAAGWVAGRAGARLLFVSVLLNPVDMARVAILSLAGTPHVLGAAGEAWQIFLGGAAPAAIVAFGVLLLWMALPLEVARRLLARKDLYA
jgi:Cu-processing system permease protein